MEEGAKVVIADTEVEAGKATAARLGGLFVETDISRMDHAERAVADGRSTASAASTSSSRTPASIPGR